MFTYCLNNPVNFADFTGGRPYQLFDTEEEAVKDAALHLGDLSFSNGWEYATAIYEVEFVTYTEQTVIKHVRLDGRRPVRIVETVTVSYTITKYTYSYIRTDRHAFLVHIPKAPPGHTRVSVIHTHPRGSNRGITQFSQEDMTNAVSIYKCPIYVYGPDGALLKYDPFATENNITTVVGIFPKSPIQWWKDCPSWLVW